MALVRRCSVAAKTCQLEGQLSWCAPVGRRAPIAVELSLPLAIIPGVVAVPVERRCAPKLLLRDIGAETTKGRVVVELAPGYRVLLPAQAQKGVESQDGVSHPTAFLVDHEALHRSDVV